MPDDHMGLRAGIADVFNRRIIVSRYTNILAIYSETYSRPCAWFFIFRLQS
jgi:hypothetical protein